MLATLCTLTLLAQGPALAFAAAGGGALDVMEVKGTAELTRAEALQAARDRAVELMRAHYEQWGQRLAAGWRPLWMPGFYADRVVQRWLQQLDPRRAIEILDRQERRRVHEFGDSFQTTLKVRLDGDYEARAERELWRALRRAERQLLFRLGGTAGFWALLALGLGWIDRLSRGYMTGRLWAIGLGLGAAVPAVVFLL